MDILKKINGIFRSYFKSAEHAQVQFNNLAKKKGLVNEQIDGYVTSYNEKQEVIENLKNQICNILRSNCNINDNVLDFGCGTGRYLRELENDSKYNLFGIDIAEQVIESHTQKNVQTAKLFSVDVLSDADFVIRHSSYFDLIYSVTTLEYISPFRLNKLFSILVSMLKEEGILILHFPVPRNLLDSLKPGYFRHYPISVEKKLKKNGFTILESHGVGSNAQIKRFNRNNPTIRELGYIFIAKRTN